MGGVRRLLLKECHLNQSKLMKDYIEGKQPLQSLFDYCYKEEIDYSKRRQELRQREFPREALTEHLLEFNKKYQCSSKTVTNIEKLLDENSVVVVGGQQAGVLTGPLYTIHKIITILKLAEMQELKLQVPVVPVFWIAGEDHDFDEINHLFSVGSDKLHKRKIHQVNGGKNSISDLKLDKEALKKLVVEVFLDSNETSNTSALLNEINKSIVESDTYIDFFSSLIHKLFKDSGIVLIDSHNQQLRKLEVPFLKKLVEGNEALNKGFLHRANELFNSGYGEPIERSENNAHLFYHLDGTRLLLERKNEYLFSDKQQVCSFTKEELLSLVETEPQNFSNNVVTRPLMQEFLLPVLTFVGGPGEIAYWASLKEVFHSFGFKVPPVAPRLSLTIVEPQIVKWLDNDESAIISVIKDGIITERNNIAYWNERRLIEETLHHAIGEVEKITAPLKELVTHFDKGLEKLAQKNELIIKKEISFLAQKIEKSVRHKYEHEWLKFDLIEANLLPNGGLQERSLNIVKYINEYGLDFVTKLVELPYEFNDTHKIIFLK